MQHLLRMLPLSSTAAAYLSDLMGAMVLNRSWTCCSVASNGMLPTAVQHNTVSADLYDKAMQGARIGCEGMHACTDQTRWCPPPPWLR